MNTQYKAILAGILGLSILLSGCSKTNAALDQPTGTNQQNQSQKSSNESETRGQNGRPEQQRPDIFGRVKSIVGNEVVLEVAEMPERANGENQNAPGAQGQTRDNTGARATGGGPVGGGSMGGGPMGGGTQRGNSSSLNFTGETKTILIPVGIPITSMGQSGSKELDIADIYKGMIMQIWFDQEDKEMIAQVRVMQGR
ncbi:MAG: hypothetical protein AB2421_05355 [Thermotaleaceae bacterium]